MNKMTRENAVKLTKATLKNYGLNDWKVAIIQNQHVRFLGRCDYGTKTILLNAFHIDLHGTMGKEIQNTIYHEVAHALCPGQQHNSVWAAKAREIGCDNTLPCSHLSLPDHVIESIRSGQVLEIEYEEQVIRTPTYKVTQLVEKCEKCGKKAEELTRKKMIDNDGNEVITIILKCYHIQKKIIPAATPFQNLVSNWWKPEVAGCDHKWDKHTCFRCGNFRLMPFQIEGARFIEQGLAVQKGVGLFDDMGLGKTVQVNAVIRYSKKNKATLYVCKSSLTFQWLKSIITWCGPAFVGQIIRSSKEVILPGLKTYIISYDLLRRMKRERLEMIDFDTVVLDECQQIKNVDSSRTQEVRKLVSKDGVKVIPLSGTPWKNRGGEFFPVLNMIAPTLFSSQQGYLDKWVAHYWEGNKLKQGGISNPDKFREYTKDILIRREYEKVMDEFPSINRMKMVIELDELNQSSYNEAVSDFVEWYNDVLSSDDGMEGVSGIELLGRMARMRHITGLAKIPATVSFVEEFLEETDRKLVIFVHHQDVGELMLEALKPICKEHGILLMQYHSKLDDIQRNNVQERFNNTKRAILIGSTLAMGEGVNLQTCADSVLHERQWNPQNEEQATPGRFRRIGQKSSVINNTIIEANDTIDQDIDSLVETKRINFHNAMNKSELQTYSESDFAKDLAGRILDKHRKMTGGKKTNISKKAKIVKIAQPQLVTY